MGTPPDERRSASSRTSTYRTLLVVGLVVVAPMRFGIVGAATGTTGPDAAGDTHDTAAVSPVQQTPFVSGNNSLTDANTTFGGAGANDTFGAALAHGDLNGDGVEDVVVGAPENDSAGGNNSGAAYVFYGPVEASDIDAASANVTLHGVDAGDRAGYAVAAGDVDDDGADDLVVGAPLEDANGQSAGTAYVVYGGDGLAANASLSTADHVLRGDSEGDRAGWAVGAVNRTSGGDDVLVGAPGNDAAAPDAGAAYVVADADPGVDTLTNATATLTGAGEGDAAGWVVAEAGDFDGDGRQDVVVSAPRNNSTAANAGATYLLTENVTGTVSLADARLTLAGETARDRAGWDAAEAGDVNNDTYDDLVVGAPFAETDDSETNAGIAYVVYGGADDAGTVNLSAAGATLAGSGEDDFAGYSVSSAGSGDVTCDNYADVLVGAPGNNSTAVGAGAAYLVAGDCPDPEPEPEPENVVVTLECVDEQGELTVTNPNDERVTFTIEGDSYTLTASGTDGDSITLSDLDDGDYQWNAETDDGTSVGGGTLTVDCDEPEPDDVLVTLDCIDEQGELTVVNPNDEQVTFTIEGNSYTLTANGTDGDSITLSDLDDGDYDWSATTEAGEHVGGGTLTVDCDQPDDVQVTLECIDEQGELTVTNPNDQHVTFTIGGDTYTLTANGTDGDSITLSDLDDGDYQWNAETDDGTNVGGGTLTVDCDQPDDVLVTFECVDEQGELTVTNPNDQNVTFTIAGDSYELAANGTAGDSVTLSDLDDGDYDWSATTEAGANVGGGTLTVDCDEPEPEDVLVTLECVDEQGELTVVNPNDQNVTFTIGGDTYTLTANGTGNDTLVLDDLDDGDYQWNAETEDGTDVGGGTLTVDCDEPDDVQVTLECVNEQGELTVVNPNDQHVTFTIGGDSYTLTASGTDGDSVTLSDLDDGDYQWNATTDDGTDVGGGTLTVDCDPEVDPDDITLTALCTDAQDGLAQYRITNDNDQAVTVTYDSYGVSGSEDSVEVPANDEVTVTVSTGDDDSATARLFYDGEQIDVKASNPKACDIGKPNVDPGDITLTALCTDAEDDLARYRVTNDNDQNVTLTYDVYGQSGSEETVEVPANDEITFVVSTGDDDNATVRLFYDGEQIDVKANNPKACDLGEPNVDPGDITLTALCTDAEDGLAQYRITNDNDQAVTVTYDSYGVTGSEDSVEVPANDEVTVTVSTGDDDSATARLFYDGEQIDVKANNPDSCDLGEPNVDPDDITLTALCTDAEDNLAQYRITNDNDQNVTLTYDVYGTDESGEVTVDASSEETIVVPASDDSATVRLFYDGEQIDVKANNPDSCDLGEPNVNPDDITLTALCTDAEDGLAQYRITNDNDQAVTVTYDSYGESGSEETIEVPANDEVTVTVSTGDDDSATARLFYDGEQIDVKASNPKACDLGEPNNQPPTADFTHSPDDPAAGERVDFDAGPSTDSDGSIASYEWDVDGDGSPDTSGATFTRIFKSAGEHQVTLTVTDDDGATDTETKTVTVTEAADPANFAVSISATNSPVTEGDAMEVDVTVENTGDEQDTQTIELESIDGTVVDNRQLTLAGGAADSFTLAWATQSGDAGTGEVRVSSDNDSDTSSVSVEAPAAPDPFDATIEFTSGKSCNKLEVTPTNTSVQYSIEWTVQSGGSDSTTATGIYQGGPAGSDKYSEVTVTYDGETVAQRTCTQGGNQSGGPESTDTPVGAVVGLLEPAHVTSPAADASTPLRTAV